MHTYDDMRISKKQYEHTLAIQDEAYKKYIGSTVGDFEVLSIVYDWGTHKQVWAVRCNTCGEVSYKPDGYQWSRGKMYSTQCKQCRTRIKEEQMQTIAVEKEIKKECKEQERSARIAAELNKTYGRFEVVEYKGFCACKVRCLKCGAVRVNGVTIQKLKAGIYPRCDCGKPRYGDERWIGKKVGHLSVTGHEGHFFICRCDCGRERVVSDSYFAQKRYRDCGAPDCEFVEDARSKAIAAKIRGNTYEGIAEAVIKSGGYKTRHLGKTGDYGVDIIAIDSDGTKIAVQCKSNMSQTAGVNAIQEVYAGGRYYGLEHFAVMSHSGYSIRAVRMAKKLGVYLSDGKSFVYPKDMKKYAEELIPTYNAVKNMKAQKLYEINGEKKTLANWAFEYGTSEENVRKGLKRGLSFENAIRYQPKKQEYTVQGVTGTLCDLYRHFCPNISMQTVRSRIQSGRTIEDALFAPPVISGRPKKRDNIATQMTIEI